MTKMQRFAYRYPRFMVDLPASFSQSSKTMEGRCIDISAAGMKIVSSQPLEPNTYGVVSLSAKGQTIQINARVVYAGSVDSGVEFFCESQREQDSLDQLIESLKA